MAENTIEPTEHTPTDSLGLSEIERLTALLESELEQPGEQTESDQEESQDSDNVDAEFEDVPEDEAVADEEVEDPTEDPEAEESEEELTFEIGNGETVTAEELKLGYLRQSDYTQKTQNLAESRKAAEAQI
jgi:hypothetical protein